MPRPTVSITSYIRTSSSFFAPSADSPCRRVARLRRDYVFLPRVSHPVSRSSNAKNNCGNILFSPYCYLDFGESLTFRPRWISNNSKNKICSTVKYDNTQMNEISLRANARYTATGTRKKSFVKTESGMSQDSYYYWCKGNTGRVKIVQNCEDDFWTKRKWNRRGVWSETDDFKNDSNEKNRDTCYGEIHLFFNK